MSLSNFLRSFSAKNPVFYGLFEQMTENIIVMNQIFIEAVTTTDLSKRKELVKKIKDLEHACDKLSQDVFQELGHNFITPFDREDIHALTSSLDDIADNIDNSAKRIMLYNIQEVGNDIYRLAMINGEAVQEVKNAVFGLRNMKNVHAIKELCIKICACERRADEVFEISLVTLLENEKDAATLIKRKDILQSMEKISDKCEDAADVIESIIVKYA